MLSDHIWHTARQLYAILDPHLEPLISIGHALNPGMSLYDPRDDLLSGIQVVVSRAVELSLSLSRNEHEHVVYWPSFGDSFDSEVHYCTEIQEAKTVAFALFPGVRRHSSGEEYDVSLRAEVVAMD